MARLAFSGSEDDVRCRLEECPFFLFSLYAVPRNMICFFFFKCSATPRDLPSSPPPRSPDPTPLPGEKRRRADMGGQIRQIPLPLGGGGNRRAVCQAALGGGRLAHRAGQHPGEGGRRPPPS